MNAPAALWCSVIVAHCMFHFIVHLCCIVLRHSPFPLSFCFIQIVVGEQTMSNCDPCCKEKATVWSKATSVTNKAELHCWCGGLAKTMWLLGIVKKGFVKESAKGKKMTCALAEIYFDGSDAIKEVEISISQIQASPPSDSDKPNDLTALVTDGGFLFKSLSDAEDDDSVTVDPTVEAAHNVAKTNQLFNGEKGEKQQEANMTPAPTCASQLRCATRVLEESVLQNLVWSSDMCWESCQDAGNIDVDGAHSCAEWSIKDTFRTNTPVEAM